MSPWVTDGQFSHRVIDRASGQTIAVVSSPTEAVLIAQAPAMRGALALCVQEIRQFHAHAYPDCKGGCPAHEAIAAAEKTLKESHA